MPKDKIKKVITDADVKHKATKLVVIHIKKKLPDEYMGSEHVNNWISEMESLLEKPGFNIPEYIEMRRKLNNLVEGILEEQIRFKLRDSWYSLGKALDKKVKLK